MLCFYFYFLSSSFISLWKKTLWLPKWLSSKESAFQCRRHGFDPWVRKISWRRKWQPTPVFLPGKSHGWRNLVGYSPWGRKESDTTERLHFLSLSPSIQCLHLAALEKNFDQLIQLFSGASVMKNPPANAGDPGSIPGSGRYPGEGNGNPLQYSCLENPMDREVW